MNGTAIKPFQQAQITGVGGAPIEVNQESCLLPPKEQLSIDFGTQELTSGEAGTDRENGSDFWTFNRSFCATTTTFSFAIGAINAVRSFELCKIANTTTDVGLTCGFAAPLSLFVTVAGVCGIGYLCYQRFQYCGNAGNG